MLSKNKLEERVATYYNVRTRSQIEAQIASLRAELKTLDKKSNSYLYDSVSSTIKALEWVLYKRSEL